MPHATLNDGKHTAKKLKKQTKSSLMFTAQNETLGHHDQMVGATTHLGRVIVPRSRKVFVKCTCIYQ